MNIYWSSADRFLDSIAFMKDLIPHAEQLRANKLFNTADRTSFICSHYFLRKMFTEISGVPFNDLDLVYPQHTKPCFTNSLLEFNISHSQAYFAIAIADRPGIKVGVDIEVINTDMDYQDIAQQYYHPNERNYVNNGKEPDMRMPIHRFYEVWTRKEAYLKMIGTGLINNLPAINTLDNLIFENTPVNIYTYQYDKFFLSVAVSPPGQIRFSNIQPEA